MKRLIDILGSAIAIVLLAPLFVSIAAIVGLMIGRPILFVQKRPGKNKEIFNFVKFRTMTNAVDSKGDLLPDKNRLTGFGMVLRNTSLDELPSLWNVLKGEMSLVGPRPLLVEYLPLYNSFQSHRHDVKPGITGWAQINGRNAISWQEKFEYDVWYVNNASIYLDIKILFLTIAKVIRREGISSQTNVTMEKFKGTD